MFMHLNSVGKTSLLCCNPFVGEQAIDKALDEFKVVYCSVGSTKQVCIHIVYIQCAYC